MKRLFVGGLVLAVVAGVLGGAVAEASTRLATPRLSAGTSAYVVFHILSAKLTLKGQATCTDLSPVTDGKCTARNTIILILLALDPEGNFTFGLDETSTTNPGSRAVCSPPISSHSGAATVNNISFALALAQLFTTTFDGPGEGYLLFDSQGTIPFVVQVQGSDFCLQNDTLSETPRRRR